MDETIATGQAGSCDLFLMAGASSLALALRETKSRKFLAAEAMVTDASDKGNTLSFLKRSLTENHLVQLAPLSSVTIAVSNHWLSLVPSGLFRAGDEDRILSFNTTRPDLDVAAIRTQGFQAQLIFGMEPELRSLLRQFHPTARILPASAGWLEYVALTGATQRERRVSVLIQEELLTVTVSESKKLLLHNAFPVHDAGEAAYYLLFVCEQLDLDHASTLVQVAGLRPRTDELIGRLQPYLPEITHASDLSFASLTYRLQDLPPSALLPVLTVSLCE